MSPLPPRAGVKARRLSHAGPGPGHRRSHPGGWTAAAGARRGRARLQVPPRPEGGLHGWPCGVCTRGGPIAAPGSRACWGSPPAPSAAALARPGHDARPSRGHTPVTSSKHASLRRGEHCEAPDQTAPPVRAPEPLTAACPRSLTQGSVSMASGTGAQAWPGSHAHLATQGPPRAGPRPGPQRPEPHLRPEDRPVPRPTRPSSRHPEAHAGAGPVPTNQQQVSGRWGWGPRESTSGSRRRSAKWPSSRWACCPAAQPGFVPGLRVPTGPAPAPGALGSIEM